MRLELVERLVCPGQHQRTPLIVVARRTRERDLLDADLGCMVCHRQAMVMNGHVLLKPAVSASGDVLRLEEAREQLNRLEAQLNLSEPGARVLLAGRYAKMADALARSAGAIVAALNTVTAAEPGVGSVWLDEAVVPFSDGTFTAAAFSDDIALPQLLDALRTLQPGARVVGTWPLPLPPGVREIARDAVEWVGEREATSENIVRITRR
jgi:hypothetical protein